MSKSNQIQLSDHFTTGRLLKFTASPIIMMIFTSIYTIVDGFFVSNCAGKTAFTALNLIYPYIQMLGCLGFMIGTAGLRASHRPCPASWRPAHCRPCRS